MCTRVYSARSRSTPCCEPQRQTAAGCRGRRWRRLQGAATGGKRRDAHGAFPGLRSGEAGTKMPFEFPIRGKALSILAHKLGRAVYFMLKRQLAFDMDIFLRT
jgi:hypothetical protein